MKYKGMSSAIRIIVAVVVLLVIALALLIASTGSVKDLTSKTSNIITKILGGDHSSDSDNQDMQNGEIPSLIEDITKS